MFQWLKKKPVRPILDSKLNPIALTPEGFTCHERFVNGAKIDVQWDSVQEIVTGKDDLWSYDEIWLQFQYGAKLWVVVSEEQPGFMQLAEEMRRRFPSIPDDWYFKVMVPAFEQNYTVLFRRWVC